MNIEERMLQWSQTVYGVAHSLHIAHTLKLGNLETLLESLRAAQNWNRSDLGFQSCLPEKGFKAGSIKLDGKDHEEVFAVLSENIVRILFVNLTVLADECLAELIVEAGVEPPNYLTAKAEWVRSRINGRYAWAADGLLEMCALRNAIVHANGCLNASTLSILMKAGINNAKEGHVVSLAFGDLFRYRRALRTILGEVEKWGK